MKYRKKPVVIEAVCFTGDKRSMYEVAGFVGRHLNYEHGKSGATIEIATLEGVMTASEGDYIIKGVNGEFYPCKPDIFEKTYEKVED